MDTKKPRRTTHWPNELAAIGAIRFARRSSNFDETVRFYRELVGLPLYETFGESYGSNGAIFGLPSSPLTMEIVEAVDAVAVDHHEQLCLYFPDAQTQRAAVARLQQAGHQPIEQHPYWEATGAATYRDPDGREVVFAPFVYGVNEPGESSTSGKHEFPSD
jgi:catechol 2,3-dioxygenase-like lactoylglutathione lyase family enzyme